jgi:hypothetical protein
MNCFRPILLLTFVYSLSISVAKDKEKKYIYFQEIEGKAQHKVKLPIKCRMYELGKKKRVGTIEGVNSEQIIFSYFNYDSSDVAAIMDLNIPRREKDKKIDSLYDASKVFKQLSAQQIQKIEILSGDASLGRQVLMLVSSIALLGSGFGLMASTSNHVGEGVQYLDWVWISGMAISAGTMAMLTKKVYVFEKWKFSSEAN